MTKTWTTHSLVNFAALILGMLLTSAFAPYGYYPLAVVSLAGLLVLLLDTTKKQAFWVGFAFGVGYFGTGVNWVFHSIHVIGGVAAPIAYGVTGLLVVFLAFFPAGVGYALSRFFPATNTVKLICGFPVCWVMSEWVRSWIFTGFPWLLVGYSQTNSPLAGYAPIFNVYGISLAVVMSAALLINAFYQLRQKQQHYITVSMVALILIWIIGFTLTGVKWTSPQKQAIPVSLVQGNIPQVIKWSEDHLQLSLNRYAELTQPLFGKNRFIVWPEAAVPLALQDASDYIEKLDESAKATNTNLILGIPIQTQDGKSYYNALVTLGKEKQVYLKRRLVPYGEYVPFSNLFANLFDFMHIPMSNMIPGSVQQDLFTLDGIKVLASICYEIAFPQLIHSSNKDLGFLLVASNDAWFGDSSAQAQHLQMAIMAAMEFRRPLLFVSNDGITAIIGPNGKILASAPPREVYVLSSLILPTQGLTPYMRFGTDPTFFLLLCLLIVPLRIKLKALRALKISKQKT